MGKQRTTTRAAGGGSAGHGAAGLPTRRFEMVGEDRSDIIIPRLVIHQGDVSVKFLGRGTAGHWFDTGRREPIGQGDQVAIVIIFAWAEYIEWRGKRGELKGMAARSFTRDLWADDAFEWAIETETDKRGQAIGERRVPPPVTRYRNFLVLIDGYDRPLCLSCRPWKEWGQLGKYLINTEKGRSTFGRYKLATRLIRDQYSYYVPAWDPPSDPSLAICNQALELYPKMRPLIDAGQARPQLVAEDVPGSNEYPVTERDDDKSAL